MEKGSSRILNALEPATFKAHYGKLYLWKIKLTKQSQKIESILRNYFGLDPKTYLINFEIIQNARDPEKFAIIKDLYLENLNTHRNREKISKQLYIDDELIIHVQQYFSRSDISAIKPASELYYPVCTIEEILRIEKLATASDYLLKIRADAIADNARLNRIFMSRKENYIGEWSLSGYYNDSEFTDYISRLSAEHSAKCLSVPAGFAFLREPNGACISTKGGKIIVVAEALHHFLFYMNLFLFGRELGVNGEDIGSALVLAFRTMLQTEAPDFDLDSRGELPINIDQACRAVTNDQIKFVIGHEYAHLLLNHLKEGASTTPANVVLTILSSDELPEYYTPRQQQEFDADIGSLMHANYSDQERANVLNAASLFFLHLDFFYAISDYINPSFGGVKTHPAPIKRLWALRKEILSTSPITSETLYSDDDLNKWIDYISGVKNSFIENYLPYHIDVLEMFGSIYLPSYRKEVLHDRFDF